MAAGSIKVKCKVCGRMAPSEEFVLDPEYKMMVCQNCVKERRMREDVRAKVKEQRDKMKEEEKKAPARDSDDEYLERAYKAKMSSTVQVEWIDEVKAKYKCPKCGYTFIINTEKMTPTNCPYCASPIKKFRY